MTKASENQIDADISAQRFTERLEGYCSLDDLPKTGENDVFMGVTMGQVFTLAKEFIDMPPSEIEKLLESPIHEVRAGGLSIMGKQAERKKTPESRKKNFTTSI